MALPPSSVHPNSNAALGTGLRRYDGVGAPIRPGGTSYARHSGEGRNPDRRPDMNQCAFQARPVVEPFVALPPSSVHPNSNAALGTGLRRYDGIETLAAILRCRTSTMGWTAGARSPLPCRHNGLEGQCLCASQCPHERHPPEARPPQAHPLVIPAKAGLQNPRSPSQHTPSRAHCVRCFVTRRTGYRPSPVRRRGGTDQARWRLIHSSFRRRPESRSALTAALGRGVVNALPLDFHTARRTPQVSPAGCTCGTWS